MIFVGCISTEENNSSCEGKLIEVSEIDDLLMNSISPATVIDARVDENDLLLELSVSGCDDDQEIDLGWVNLFSIQDPSLIFADLLLENPQVCNAVFKVERCFDISELKALGSDEFIIEFRNSNRTVLVTN